MFIRYSLSPSPALKKWCACIFILLAPGALFVVPLIWLYKVLRKKQPKEESGRTTDDSCVVEAESAPLTHAH